MKIYSIIFLCVCMLTSSCKEDKETELVNRWKLIEILQDPGDGSGTFQPVTSDKTIEFYENGTVLSNGILCQMGTESNSSTMGSYDETEMSITPSNCGIVAYVIYYQQSGSELILMHPCIEACQEKYQLLN